MRFVKPEGKKYTDICIEFDKEFYEPNRDDMKLFGYMYIIFRMLAFKKNYFSNNFSDYDGFAQFAASTIYMRFLKKWANGERVKSFLNYAKSSLYPLKVMYQNESFGMTTQVDEDGIPKSNIGDNMRKSVQDDYRNEYMVSAIFEELDRVPDLVDEVVGRTPYASDPKTFKNLRISCKLTLLSQLTLPKGALERLEATRENRMAKADDYMLSVLENERSESPILWELPDSMSPYVACLVNEVRKELGTEINDARNRYTLPDDVLDSIVSSAYTEAFPESNKNGVD